MIDTSAVAPESWPRPFDLVEALPSLEQNERFIEYNTNLGVGFDFTISRESGMIHFKSIFGKNYFNLVRRLNDSRVIQNDNDYFYLVQAEVMENKLLGLKLGLEVRGYFEDQTPKITLDRNTPYFTIYLAKQFSFDKIASLFKPN